MPMKTIEGYSKEKYTDTSVLLAGGGAKALSDFIGTLTWDSTNKKITYKKIGDTDATDLVSLSWSNLSGVPNSFTPSAHEHSAADITSGTLVIARGGTNATTQEDINKNFIANLSEGSSNFTDNTEIISSYASNNGFADSNAKNVPYKRDAIKMYNYIKGKLDSVYSATGHNHDDKYVELGGDTMTGDLSVPHLNITNTTGSDEITFARGSYNYLRAKTSGGIIAFIANGKSMSGSSVDCAIGGGWVSVNNGVSGAGNYNLYVNGKAYASTSVTSASFIVPHGTASQFLKANGTVDSSTYSLSNHTHSEYAAASHSHSNYATVDYTYGKLGAVINCISGQYMLGYTMGFVGLSNSGTSVAIDTCSSGGAYTNVQTITSSDSVYLNGSTKNWFYQSGHAGKKIKLTFTAPQYIKSVAIYIATLDSSYSGAVTILSNDQTSSVGTWGSWHIISFVDSTASTQIVEINTTYALNDIRIGGFRIAYTNPGALTFPGNAWSANSAGSVSKSISFKNTAGTTVSFNGSAAVDLTGGVNYATSAGSASYADSAGSASSATTADKVANSITFKNTAGTSVSFNGSVAKDLTSGVNYAAGAGEVKTVKTEETVSYYPTFVETNNNSAALQNVYTNKYLKYYANSGELQCKHITLTNDGALSGGLWVSITGGNNNPINASTSATMFCIYATNSYTHSNTFTANGAVIGACGSGYHYDILAPWYTSKFGGLELGVESNPVDTDSTSVSYSQKNSIYYVNSSKTVYLPTTYARNGRIIFVINDGNNKVTFQATGKTIKYFRRSGSGSATGIYSGERFQCIYICIYYSNTWYIAPTDVTD